VRIIFILPACKNELPDSYSRRADGIGLPSLMNPVSGIAPTPARRAL